MAENIAIYRRMFASWMGEGKAGSLRNLNFTEADAKRLGIRVGDSYECRIPGVRGVRSQYAFIVRAFRARGTITDGQILMPYAAAAARTANAVTPFPKDVITTDGAFTVDDLRETIVEVVAGTGIGQVRGVFDNTATKLSVAARDGSLRIAAADTPDALTTALDATSDVSVFDPREAVATAAATDLVTGVALGAVTSGNVSLYCERGLALVKVKGDTGGKAGTSLGLLVPSGVAGEALPDTDAGITAAEAATFFGALVHAYTGASALRLALIFGRFSGWRI